MMKYLAFGLLIALLLDATIVRMFLVPAIMKLLGDDCWWAPKWMKRLQHKIGLGETTLPDERVRPALPAPGEELATAVAIPAPGPLEQPAGAGGGSGHHAGQDPGWRGAHNAVRRTRGPRRTGHRVVARRTAPQNLPAAGRGHFESRPA